MPTAPFGVATRSLVLGSLRPDGTVGAGELYDLAATLGLTTEQVRLAIRRLVDEGALVRTGRGRGARLAATSDGDPLRLEGALLAYAFEQDAGRAPWDGRWHIVSFSIPEKRRAQRDALRRVLRFYGGAPLAGMYVSPNPWEPHLLPWLTSLGVRDAVTTATATDLDAGGVREPRELAERLWPLRELDARYAALLPHMRHCRDNVRRYRGDDRVQLLNAAFSAAVPFADVAEDDPQLPPQLLPAAWAGKKARALLAQTLAALEERLPYDERPAIVRSLARASRS